MYKITIVKVERVEETDRSYEKTSDKGNKDDGGAVYQYVEYPVMKTVETKVFEQTSDEINLKDVIFAVNKIE